MELNLAVRLVRKPGSRRLVQPDRLGQGRVLEAASAYE